MSIPNETLRKLLEEIEAKAAFSQQQINVVKAQIAAKNREGRMVQLTSSEVESLPKGTNVYEGVGKMFIWSPAAEVKKRLDKEEEGIKSDTSALEKKLHYLETTYINSRQNLDKLLRSGPGS